MFDARDLAHLQDTALDAVTFANVRAINPHPLPERLVHIRVEAGLIAQVVPAHEPVPVAPVTIDCTGLMVVPGLVDIQVHFREPGQSEAETIATGARLASAGGHTAVVTMPNTTPAIDSVDMVHEVRALAAPHASRIDVITSACITKGRAGEELVDMPALYHAGVRVFTDDGNAVMNTNLMRQALMTTTAYPGMVVSQHCEDESIVAGGAINEGVVADQLGVHGRPGVGETAIVARDVALAMDTGGRYHVLHLSTADSAAFVAFGKRMTAPGQITAECTPQHLVLTHEAVLSKGTHAKMNPPLRTQRDVDALRAALQDGTIDAIATDHAPHHPDRKALPLDQAPPGMLGAQHSWQVAWTHLVLPGLLTPGQLVRALSTNPAKIANIDHVHGGPIVPGRPANLAFMDPNATVTITPSGNLSLSRNNPWDGDVLTSMTMFVLKTDRIWAESTLMQQDGYSQ